MSNIPEGEEPISQKCLASIVWKFFRCSLSDVAQEQIIYKEGCAFVSALQSNTTYYLGSMQNILWEF